MKNKTSIKLFTVFIVSSTAFSLLTLNLHDFKEAAVAVLGVTMFVSFFGTLLTAAT